MPTAELNDLRSDLVHALLDRVQQERFPSVTMLDMIESLLEPEDLPDYVQHLIDLVNADPYPSIDMLRRIQRLV